jgi:diguanylate cyclase (GGDEF)-like protein
MAHHDSLTGLPNRATLHDRIERELSRPAGLALLLVDLDNVKTISDTMGHLAGDALLFEVAARLGRVAPPDGPVARLGGDEFAVLVRGTETEPAERLPASIIGSLRQPFHLDTSRVYIWASVGIAIAPRDGRTLSDVMRRADLALYAARSEGRGRARVFDSAFEREARERRALEEDLRVACQNGELRLVYQPLVDIASSRIVGAEALMRWRYPQHGEVTPGRFIPIAEDSGLIVAMGDWALGEACREAARWPRDLSVAVNVSAAQMQDRQIALAMARALQESVLLPGRLHVEMTESVLLDQPAAKVLFTQLRALGVSLSLDDFGTGYSSLSYLRLFPFDRIKIYRSFVREPVGSADCAAIVHVIARLARDLGIETVAELCVVTAAGCHHAQGDHFGRPMEAAEFRHLVGMAEPAGQALARPA